MQILALIPGGIGEQLLFFPTLTGLHDRYPGAQIDVVVEPRAKGAYQICPLVENVWMFDFQDRNSPADWGNLLGVIRDREYDAVLATGQQWIANILLWLSGIPKRIGYGSGGHFFLTDTVPYESNQYLGKTYYALTQPLGLEEPLPASSPRLPQADLDWAEQEQRRLGVESSGYLAIAPDFALGEADSRLTYPTERWVEAIQHLQQRRPDLPVVVLEGSSSADRQGVAILQQAIPNLKVMVPAKVGQLAAAIAAANLLVSIDGDALQIAVAMGTYTIALFGPSNPSRRLLNGEQFASLQATSSSVADIPVGDILNKLGV